MNKARVVIGQGFRICFDDGPDFLRAYVFDGTDSLEVSIAMWQMLSAECEATGCTRLLVVEDLHGTVTQDEIALVIDAIAQMGFTEMRVAFVELREDIQIAELGEIMSVERGINARVFSHESDARRWLLFGS